VIELSEPNEKLLIVNRLLEQVSTLDQLQRIQVLQEPHHTKSFLAETQEIRLTIDTLSEMYGDNAEIAQQIDSMKLILATRDQVYIDYASLRAGQLDNSSLSGTLKSITGLVRSNRGQQDVSVKTSETRITTTAAPKAKVQESFWKRLFGRKKKEKAGKQFVREEKNVRVDTLSVARKDSILAAIEKAMNRLEHEEITRTSTMLLKELDLVHNGNTLVNELWRLLHNIQEDEINNIRSNKDTVIGYLNASINRAGTIMLVLFLVIGVMIFMVLNDITRNNTYREQLRIAKENAEQLSMMKQRFLSNMSHEIRTPLQSIVGFAEQVKTQPKPQPKMIDAIHASAGHLLQIVNEVLDYSRIISGKFTLEKRPFNLDRLAEEVSANMKLQAENKKLQFVFDNSIPTVKNYMGDDFRLKQVLYNLLGNAIKFTSAGKVTFTLEQADHFVRMRVADTGTGISEKDLARIFNEFEQTDTSIARRFGGTGLGLSISKALVENMGGTISVESREGSGTAFTLLIPLEETAAQPEHDHSGTTAVTYANIPTLVVEDDPFILQLCDTILTNQGIAHTCYTSAEELLAAKWDSNTRIVFSDMRLPGITGAELVKQLRKKVKNVKFVALTAQVLPEEKELMLKQGFDTILSKPFREQELLSFYATGPVPAKNNDVAGPPALDISLLRQMTMNDETLLNTHLVRFVEATEKDLEQLRMYIDEKNQAEAYEMIHKLAGRIGQIGAPELMTSLRELEQELKRPKRLTAMKEKLGYAISDTEKIIEEIRKMVP
jgi:signal transduction histidine kinase/CheY-like chemotaxis protein